MSDLQLNWTEKALLRFELHLAVSWLLMLYSAVVTSGFSFHQREFSLSTPSKHFRARLLVSEFPK
jgi:hypothetical protein